MLLLLDANNLLSRSFYGRPPLYDAKGLPIHAVSGLVTWVLRFHHTYKPTMMVACWDCDGPTFRHQLYPAYKATRKPTPPELTEQIPRAKKALENLGIAQVEVSGYEADDVIGTLASKSKELVRIVSGDRDLFQVISRNVLVDYLRPRKQPQPLTYFRHEEIYGIDPGQWVDFKALVGDSTDNIPGVPGIGEKTVWPILKQGLSLKDLLQYPDIFLGVKAARKLVEFKEQALLSWDLAKINCHVPLEMPSNYIVDIQSQLSQTTLRILGVRRIIA
ncbi:5'-3' exonuclease [Desulfosporosinus sp. FKA]|uniref:5'-3' exonuclease n=1 Tax=Desulfosporosinus sp. FKA TaxID=1969834 RepID=UPI000B49D590|nr:5'-3' exonuclease [Desulfosporosinus sp. FKA]